MHPRPLALPGGEDRMHPRPLALPGGEDRMHPRPLAFAGLVETACTRDRSPSGHAQLGVSLLCTTCAAELRAARSPFGGRVRG
jgi:hypothetical protein